MPADFDSCLANGGHVITKKVNKTQFIHVCYPQGGGSPVHGEVKTQVKKSKK